MIHAGLDELRGFAIIARECSFTRAAARMGVSQSALSHSIRALEERVGVRLLARTTRSVALTEAGARLLQTLQPALSAIDDELTALSTFRDKPMGTVRLTMPRHGYTTIVRPLLPDFFKHYPDVHVEISIDDGFTDIVGERFDAGLRFGELVEKDMVAVRVGPDVPVAIVGAPAYLDRHRPPLSLQDLSGHRCINYRLATAGSLYSWQLQDKSRRVDARVQGVLTLNDGDAIVNAALDGLGLAYLFLDQVQDHLRSGTLVRVLERYSPVFPGYRLYHSSRRQTPPSLAALINVLREKTNTRSLGREGANHRHSSRK